VLQYKGGSPCGASQEQTRDKRGTVRSGAYRTYDDDDDEKYSSTARKESDQKPEKDKEKDSDKDPKTTRRKSATISFLCDRDPDIQTAASFVGTDPDECAYFFEVRSQHACAGVEPHKPGSVGPGSVFAIIFFIAVLVYVAGGVFYQRTVAHARGWRQLPNYSLWAGIWNFARVSPHELDSSGLLTSLGYLYNLRIFMREVSPKPERIPYVVGLSKRAKQESRGREPANRPARRGMG